ncbi:VWA domain-containing protein [Paramuribaculum intestinale]|uniref:vWA domain-containing protein n=1 Tax=Paramuribaculum intestinale TaxID=2094151 RepID=UPI0025A9574F|nr:VWA domain-containing protein [Paramuribaculum intestinale]
MQFAHPTYLWFLLLPIPYLAWYILNRNRKHATMSVSTIAPYAKNGRPLRAWLLHGLFVMRALCLAALIVILARPQAYDRWSTSNTQGTDIVIALDISTSMLARDFKPDRFEAAKKVASQFVSGRESDNIGVVIFAGESFTAVPMTTDKALLVNYINDIKMGMLQDATAIGDGLATSINRIKDGKAKSKSIILLTDGSNNTGNVAPVTAAEIAKKYGIKVYTIGIGRNGMAPFPQENAFGRIEYVNLPVVIDEATLRDIASITGGKYFRATDNNVLKQVFDEIDALEKTVLDVRNFSHTEENYMMWAWIAFALLALELLLRFTVLRTIP